MQGRLPSSLRILAVAVCSLIGSAALVQAGTLTGTISDFQCGDNCYLSVDNAAGKTVTGLCAAPACRSWNENAAMPAKFLGRRVKVETSIGTQFDGSGNKAGRTTAFKTLEFVK